MEIVTITGPAQINTTEHTPINTVIGTISYTTMFADSADHGACNITQDPDLIASGTAVEVAMDNLVGTSHSVLVTCAYVLYPQFTTSAWIHFNLAYQNAAPTAVMLSSTNISERCRHWSLFRFEQSCPDHAC